MLSFRKLTILVLSLGGIALSSPAYAQVQVTFRNKSECESKAEYAAHAVFLRKKLRLDQRYRGNTSLATYKAGLRNLQQAEARDRSQIARQCRGYFLMPNRPPWVYRWAE